MLGARSRSTGFRPLHGKSAEHQALGQGGYGSSVAGAGFRRAGEGIAQASLDNAPRPQIDRLDAEVKILADAIIAKSPVAVAAGKKMFYPQLEVGMEDAYKQAAEVMACNMMAEDAGEGIDAFIGKRPPVWKGR